MDDMTSLSAVASPSVAGKTSETLSVVKACNILRSNGFEQYTELFSDNMIDGSMLGKLEGLWEELGVDKKAHRIRILKIFVQQQQRSEADALSDAEQPRFKIQEWEAKFVQLQHQHELALESIRESAKVAVQVVAAAGGGSPDQARLS